MGRTMRAPQVIHNTRRVHVMDGQKATSAPRNGKRSDFLDGFLQFTQKFLAALQWKCLAGPGAGPRGVRARFSSSPGFQVQGIY